MCSSIYTKYYTDSYHKTTDCIAQMSHTRVTCGEYQHNGGDEATENTGFKNYFKATSPSQKVSQCKLLQMLKSRSTRRRQFA